MCLDDLIEHIYKAVSGSLGTDQRTAVGKSLAGKNAGILLGQSLVLSEKIADLTAAYTDITGGNVGVRSDMAEKLGHEALAEGHDFAVGFALGIKV